MIGIDKIFVNGFLTNFTLPLPKFKLVLVHTGTLCYDEH